MSLIFGTARYRKTARRDWCRYTLAVAMARSAEKHCTTMDFLDGRLDGCPVHTSHLYSTAPYERVPF